MNRTTVMLALSIILTASQAALALDPGSSVGVGGRSGSNASAGGPGFSSQNVSSPGPTFAVSGGRGVASSIGAGGVNRGTSDGFHSAGIPTYVTAGRGRSTMESVPGRSPTYLYNVVGRRQATSMGAIAQ